MLFSTTMKESNKIYGNWPRKVRGINPYPYEMYTSLSAFYNQNHIYKDNLINSTALFKKDDQYLIRTFTDYTSNPIVARITFYLEYGIFPFKKT